MGVRSPFTPTLSPLEKGEEGVGSGGMVRENILSALAPQSGCAEGWYRLKRKSVSGNGIIPIFCRGFPSGKRDILGRYRLKRKSVPGNSITLFLVGIGWPRAGLSFYSSAGCGGKGHYGISIPTTSMSSVWRILPCYCLNSFSFAAASLILLSAALK